MSRPKSRPSTRESPAWWRRWLGRWWPTWASPKASRPAPEADDAPQADAHAPRRSRRAARREQLYAVVRENMIRAGVLSSSYKFKVLTLDRDGHSHLVMMDITRTALDAVPEGPSGLELHLQALALERLDMEVRAVYWRVQEARADTGTGHRRADETSESVGPDEIAALQLALRAQHRKPSHPQFEPTRPMARSPQSDHDALGETQLGDLK